MIHQDPVQPISPIYHSEQDSGGELAARASGDGDGAMQVRPRVNLSRDQKRSKPRSQCRLQCCHRNPFAESIGLLTFPIARGAMNALKHLAASDPMDPPT